MRCDAMRCDAMRCDAMQCNAMQYRVSKKKLTPLLFKLAAKVSVFFLLTLYNRPLSRPVLQDCVQLNKVLRYNITYTATGLRVYRYMLQRQSRPQTFLFGCSLPLVQKNYLLNIEINYKQFTITCMYVEIQASNFPEIIRRQWR